MIIPWEELEESTLYNVLDSFILREGTDYGRQELSLEKILFRFSLISMLRYPELPLNHQKKRKQEFLCKI